MILSLVLFIFGEKRQAQQASTRLQILRFSDPLPENSKLLVWIVPNPYEERRRRIRNGGLDVTQNRRSTQKIHFGRTKLPALQRFFSFPVLRGRIA